MCLGEVFMLICSNLYFSEVLPQQEAQGALSCSPEKHVLTCTFAKTFINYLLII